MNSKITYESRWQEAVTIELRIGYDINREGACLDLYLHRMLADDCPLVLAILIRTDGSIVEWFAKFEGRTANTYWHFACGIDHPITEAQRAALARIHFGNERPFGVKGSLGRPVCEAAFDGHDRAEIERLGGIKAGTIAYTAPCDAWERVYRARKPA